MNLGAEPHAERRPIRVLIADDHPVFRSGLRTLVEECPGLTFAAEAANGEQALTACAEFTPDVVLMDIRMPGISGIDAARRIVNEYPSVGVLMLSMLEDDTSVFAAMRAGARGYVLKGAAPDDIVRAITAVAAGEVILGAAIAARISDFFQSGARQAARPFPALSSREHDILNLIAAGHGNSAIAERLALSERPSATTCPTSSRSCKWLTAHRRSYAHERPASAHHSRPTHQPTEQVAGAPGFSHP